MTTKRTPIKRPLRPRDFTPASLGAFRKMRWLERRCQCHLWKDDEICPACHRWWAAHSILYDELRCRPWEWPCVENPDEPPGWKSDLEAQTRYVALVAALAAAKKA